MRTGRDDRPLPLVGLSLGIEALSLHFEQPVTFGRAFGACQEARREEEESPKPAATVLLASPGGVTR